MSKWLQIAQYRKLYSFVGIRGSIYLSLGVVAGVLVFAAELAFAYILQMFLVVMKIAPTTATQFPSWIPTQNVYWFLSFVAAIILVRGFAQWLNSYLTSASFEIQRDHQRYRLMEWALRATSVNSGEVISLSHHGIDAVCNILSNFQGMSVFLSTSILTWIFMLNLSIKTTLIATAVLACIALFTQVFNAFITREGKILLERLEDISIGMMNNMKNLLLIQIYGTQEKEKTILRKKLSVLLDSALFFQKVFHFKAILPQVIGFILICGLSIAATRRAWIEPAMMVTYFYLFIRFVQSFSEVVRQVSAINFALPTALNFAKWWADHSHDGIRNPVTSAQQSAIILDYDGPIGWKIDQISFSYPNSKQALFSNFSLTIPSGTAVVILGESGSGKSTLLSILLGLIQPNQGKVELEAGSKTYPLAPARKSLLSHIGYVGSETFLVAGTILENLTYGLDRVPNPDEIQNALKQSGCDFISRFNDGLNHFITEQGQGLSAGQKQRISFARALLRNPKVLILDEATANLDLDTEKNLIKSLQKMKGSMTMIIVTHREALLTLGDHTLRLPIGL